MGASWEGLHAALRESATTARAASQFRVARRAEPILVRFNSAAELIGYLERDRSGDLGALDDKDQIYAALIRGVQARAEWTELAHTVLCCGLWPALDRRYRRRVRQLRDEREELAEAITAQLILLVGRMDLAQVDRVAATLTRSTLREVMDERRRDRFELELSTGRQFSEKAARLHSEVDTRLRPESTAAEGMQLRLEFAREAMNARILDTDVGIPVGMSFEGELAALRQRLARVLGDDTDLMLGVLVLDENHREAADRLGIAHAAARKRFKRALPLVRQFLVHFSSSKRS
jgi:hypothetical protein